MTGIEDLERRIGRLLIARIPGTKLDEECKQAFASGKISGAVIFKENARSLDQLAELMRAVIKSSLHTPVLMVDQEGGAVQRFDHIVSPLPSPMALAATADLPLISEVTTLSAKQLQALGFNCLLAPVLDVLSNPLNPIIATRAFGDNAKKVSEFGTLVAKAINEAGITAVGKHFPGHGATLEDSHTDLAVNPTDTRTLWQRDLVPFRNCLADLKAILVGHVWVTAVDAEPLPASLSTKVIKGILREYLGYTGVIMTDDMVMKAITSQFGLAEATAMAVEAGNDLVLVGASIEETLQVQEYLVQAVQSGRISEERVEESSNRINQLFPRAPKAVSKKSLPALAESIASGAATALKASIQAITVLRGGLPPITSGQWIVLAPNHSRYPMKLASYLNERAKCLALKGLIFEEIRYSLDPSEEEAKEIQTECSERNCIYLTYRALANQGQMLLGALLAQEARQKVTIATDVPYDIMGLPGWDDCLCTFDPSDLAMQALASILLGEQSPQGTCPVNLEFQLSTNR